MALQFSALGSAQRVPDQPRRLSPPPGDRASVPRASHRRSPGARTGAISRRSHARSASHRPQCFVAKQSSWTRRRWVGRQLARHREAATEAPGQVAPEPHGHRGICQDGPFEKGGKTLPASSAISWSGRSCHPWPKRSGGAAKQLDSSWSGSYVLALSDDNR